MLRLLGSAGATLAVAVNTLSPKEWVECNVLKTEEKTSGGGATGATKRITFNCQCNLTPVAMVMVKTPIGEKNAVKYYNPVELGDDSFAIEVKAYPEGRVSGKLHNAVEGDAFQVKGPMQQFAITRNAFKEVVFVVGGTGITPAIQLIKQLLNDPDDHTAVTLIFANKNPDAVMLTDQLKTLGSRLTVHHMLSSEGNRVDAGSLKALLPVPSAEVKVYVCGPGSMTKAVSGGKVFGKGPPQQGDVTGYLSDLGFDSTNVYKI